MNTIISEKFAELGQLLQQYMTQETQAPRPVTVADMSEIETMVPEYLDPGVKLLKVPTIYRFNQSGLRYYFSIDDEQVTFFPSVTTILKETLPTSPGLQELRDRLGKEGYYAFMNERANYGTLLHVFAADYQRHNRNFDTDTISQRIRQFSEDNNLRFDTHNWSYYLNKDLRAIAQFIHDYDVKPIAIELIGKYTGKLQTVLGDNKSELDVCFSGAIDLLCEMTVEEKGFYGEVYKSGDKKGQPKESKQSRRVLAIVDFKSGKNGFHPEHEMQLHMYKMMAEQSCGIKVDKLFNVSPKDWETVPTYNIKDQTDSQHAERIKFLLGSYFCIYPGVRDILIMSGKLNGGNMSDCTKWVPASEWVLKKLNIFPDASQLEAPKKKELSAKELKKIEAENLLLKAGVTSKAPEVKVEPVEAPEPEIAQDTQIVETAEPTPEKEIEIKQVQEEPVKDELHELAEQVKANPVQLSRYSSREKSCAPWRNGLKNSRY